MYLLTINSPDIDNVAMSLYDITVKKLLVYVPSMQTRLSVWGVG